MAQRHGVSKSTISNIWRSHNLKPHSCVDRDLQPNSRATSRWLGFSRN